MDKLRRLARLGGSRGTELGRAIYSINVLEWYDIAATWGSCVKAAITCLPFEAYPPNKYPRVCRNQVSRRKIHRDSELEMVVNMLEW